MPTLIIPDIHQRIERTESILDRWEAEADEVVFLGDYFDPKSRATEGIAEPDRVMEWLLDSLERKNRVHLLGNHDLSYRWPEELMCSGHSAGVMETILDKAPPNFWQEFGYGVAVHGWFVSHAGIHPSFLRSDDDCGGPLEQALSAAEEMLAAADPRDERLQVGAARGGMAEVGGIPWLDWSQEFAPIPGLSQIVGHTSDSIALRSCSLQRNGAMSRHELLVETIVRETFDLPEGRASANWCIDCGLAIVALVEPGRVTFIGTDV